MATVAPAILPFSLACAVHPESGWARPDRPAAAAPATTPPNADLVDALGVDVVGEFPHDRSLFTQGLEMRGRLLYESTGLTGHSLVQAGPVGEEPQVRRDLDPHLFGEGITLTDSSLWQLTWRNGIAVERDAATLKERRRVPYSGEGWGLCYQQSRKRLIMSDGSARLHFRDHETFALLGHVTVQAAGTPVERLNELECVGDTVYANILGSDRIARLDPDTGDVTAYVDASSLMRPSERATARAGVLNGIAAVPGTADLLLTGKNWPTVYRVSLRPSDGAR
ncbi:glutaminyl-peptide cyclotransferase [Streptomyces poriticola]|uniref:glutaminyl-peptide cyclotransferase n=1 Tax=Streptomyces poriticola TaxID=3120506 RepID=UPI002FCE66BF